MRKYIYIFFVLFYCFGCNNLQNNKNVESQILNSILDHRYDLLLHKKEAFIHPVLMPTSWYGCSFKEVLKNQFKGINLKDEILSDMDLRDSIIIDDSERLYSSHNFSASFRKLPKQKSNVANGDTMYIHFSVIGYSSDASAAMVIFNIIESSKSGGSIAYYLKKDNDGKFTVVKEEGITFS